MRYQLTFIQRMQAIATCGTMCGVLANALLIKTGVISSPGLSHPLVLLAGLVGGALGPRAMASTWAPFQPQAVKRICAHLTAEEHAAVLRQVRQFGSAVGILILAIVIGALLPSWTGIHWLQWLIPLPVILLLSLLGGFRHAQLEFLRSTAWARKKAHTPDKQRPRRRDEVETIED